MADMCTCKCCCQWIKDRLAGRDYMFDEVCTCADQIDQACDCPPCVQVVEEIL